ncbi:hypothetical protein B0H16DRAFT_1478917 [Mycena metata]|uniref:Uncharacterized protein n=1 Tax=Mycena metata TaxID=1033252 RepID=A0AAD7H724_9AGAR|nr:hypothetical protein B0H16DRAFT_1478917 [Mycena metata]
MAAALGTERAVTMAAPIGDEDSGEDGGEGGGEGGGLRKGSGHHPPLSYASSFDVVQVNLVFNLRYLSGVIIRKRSPTGPVQAYIIFHPTKFNSTNTRSTNGFGTYLPIASINSVVCCLEFKVPGASFMFLNPARAVTRPSISLKPKLRFPSREGHGGRYGLGEGEGMNGLGRRGGREEGEGPSLRETRPERCSVRRDSARMRTTQLRYLSASLVPSVIDGVDATGNKEEAGRVRVETRERWGSLVLPALDSTVCALVRCGCGAIVYARAGNDEGRVREGMMGRLHYRSASSVLPALDSTVWALLETCGRGTTVYARAGKGESGERGMGRWGLGRARVCNGRRCAHVPRRTRWQGDEKAEVEWRRHVSCLESGVCGHQAPVQVDDDRSEKK